MQEGAQQSPVTPDTSARPGLQEILKSAREAGEQTRKQASESLATRLQLRDRASKAWDGVKRVTTELKTATLNTTDTVAGVVMNADARAAFGGYMKDRATDAKDAMQNKALEISGMIMDKKDAAVNAFQTKVRELGQRANEVLIQPQIARAQEIGTKIKDALINTKDKGVDTANKVKMFFRDQAESTKNSIKARGNETAAQWNRVLAAPRELRANIMQGFAEKMLGTVSADRAIVDTRRTKAVEHRSAAATLRTGGSR